MFNRHLFNFCLSGSVLDSPSRLDEEHRLIARYAARLAAEAGNVVSRSRIPASGREQDYLGVQAEGES